MNFDHQFFFSSWGSLITQFHAETSLSPEKDAKVDFTTTTAVAPLMTYLYTLINQLYIYTILINQWYNK